MRRQEHPCRCRHHTRPDGGSLAWRSAEVNSNLGRTTAGRLGERLTPTHAVKKGTRYRYYISTGLVTGKRKPAAGGWRIPAGNLEGLVIERLRKMFAAPGELLDVLAEHAFSGIGTRELVERAGRIAGDLELQTKSDRLSSA